VKMGEEGTVVDVVGNDQTGCNMNPVFAEPVGYYYTHASTYKDTPLSLRCWMRHLVSQQRPALLELRFEMEN